MNERRRTEGTTPSEWMRRKRTEGRGRPGFTVANKGEYSEIMEMRRKNSVHGLEKESVGERMMKKNSDTG